jgi:4-amino-4-deoxy-L-arabinose transferase-like glycosyltransferase
MLVILVFYNLEFYPRTWFDEGWHLQMARYLALTGRYRFGPAVGPTVFYPIAWVFRLFGVGLLQARLVMVGYLLLALVGFYLLVRQVYDGEVATIASALLVTSNGVGLFKWGRQALGEVPALAYFLLGALCWFRAVEQEHRGSRFVLVAGLSFALSILTKNMFIVLIPSLIALWLLNRLYYRQAKSAHIVLLIACTAVPVVGWYVALWFRADPRLIGHMVEQWQAAPARSILFFEPSLVLRNIKFVFGPQAFFFWGLPGLLYGGLLALRRDRDGFKEAFLLVFALLWLAWYVVASIGWDRYAFPGLAVTAIFVANLYRDLMSGDRISLCELWNTLQRGKGCDWPRRLFFFAVLLAITLCPLGSQVRRTVCQVDRTPQQMAAYLNTHIDQEAVIETWEPEIGFLTEHTYHYPPSHVLDAACRNVALGGSFSPGSYDFLEADPEYVLVGGFGKWTGLYPTKFLQQECVLVTSIGAYDLYRVKK